MDYKDFAVGLAKKAGREIKKNFVYGMKKEWKDNNTPITKTDIAVNKMVIREVKKYFPNHGILGEEESYGVEGREYLWVCDPVDGTVPFSHGMPICTFSLGLVKNGQPLLGVVYDPFMDRLYFAQKGKGAFLNGKRIRVSKAGMEKGVVNWEWTFTKSEFKAQYPKTFGLSLCSFVYGGMLVASGEIAASLYSWTYAHDGAAIKVIVEEAGGKATDVYGKSQRYDGRIKGCLVSNGKVHNEIIMLLKKLLVKYPDKFGDSQNKGN